MNTGYYINCENCGKDIYRTKTQYNRSKHHFCSNKCQKEYQHIQTFELRECEICKSLFEVSKKSKQRFCSIQCQGKWQSTQTGELNPRTNRVECRCDNCGNNLKIIKSIFKRNKYNFCNETCRKEWYSNCYSQSLEWREKSRIRAAKILKNNQPTTNTLPQIIVNDILNQKEIKYENEKNFKYYSVDNYLIEHDLIIEVMGDYWHCNPTIYSIDKSNNMQKKRIPKDKAKNTYLYNRHKIKVLYWWEHDIYHNSNICSQLIDLYINNNGILQNYHSFNYIESTNGIELKNKIIAPYFE